MGTELFAVVYMNHGRWVARCPRPYCTNAEQFGQCQDGTVGGLAEGRFRCRLEQGGCGLTCHAQWPDAELIPQVEQLLLARPVPATRNWEPGETLSDLLGENFEHGIVPASTLRGEPLTILGDSVTSGALASVSRPEIEA